MKIRAKRFDKSLPLPNYEELAAGFDFYCREEVVINPGETAAIPANLALEIPEDFFLLVSPRSSTWSKYGLIMPHSNGIVDPFYRAIDHEIMLQFYNPTRRSVTVGKGDKIAQGILLKYEKVDFEEVNGQLGKSKVKKWGLAKRKTQNFK
tara:strand:+ start:12 stop:461 length:450 start_codon:yes stop_codon:yes gene_type:complete